MQLIAKSAATAAVVVSGALPHGSIGSHAGRHMTTTIVNDAKRTSRTASSCIGTAWCHARPPEDTSGKDPMTAEGRNRSRCPISAGVLEPFASRRLLAVGPIFFVEHDAEFEECYAAQWPRLVAALAHAVPEGDYP